MRKEIFETTWIISMFLTIDNHGYKRCRLVRIYSKLAIVWLKDKTTPLIYTDVIAMSQSYPKRNWCREYENLCEINEKRIPVSFSMLEID